MARRKVLLSTSENAGHSIDTLRVLVAREFRMRYKGSTLGLLWALLTPLGTVVVLQFLFGQVLGIGGAQFAIFLYTGLLPWGWFHGSLLAGSATLSENRDLVRRPFFSKPLLPWTVTVANFGLYLFSLPVLVGMMLYNGVPMTGALVAFPVIWLVQGLLTIGLTMLMAAIGMLVRDWQHMIALLLTFWFYLTPIFYDISQVPSEYAWGFSLNPMAAIVTAHRAVILDGHLPDWASLAPVGAASLALLALSILIFRALEDSFIDRT